jgi:hypothetical protein
MAFNNETAGPLPFAPEIRYAEGIPQINIGTRLHGFHLKIKISSVNNELTDGIIPGPGTCPLNFASNGSLWPLS